MTGNATNRTWSFPGLYIGGQWVAGERTEPILAPHDPEGGVIAHAPWGGPETLEAAVVASQSALEVCRNQTGAQRASLLHRIAQLLHADREALAELITAESGKPITLAEAEVARACDTFTVAAEEARNTGGQPLHLDALAAGKNHVGSVRRFPIGVIYGITPFNFPLNLVAHKVAPALATGNAIIIKPAPKTPLTALRLASWIHEAGIPPGQLNVVTCDNAWAGRLVGDPRIAMTSFTGSPDVGWKIKDQCRRQKVVLELGGNAGVIVHSDADWEKAVPMMAQGGFSNAGQSCISVQRVFIQESIYATVRDRLVDWVRNQVKMGDPRDRSVMVGPMIDPIAARRVESWVAEAVTSGGRCLCGGKARGPWLEPTVLENVRPELAICSREVFGPVVVLASYDRFQDAIRRVNDSEFGLQAGVFTRDLALAHQAYQQLEVGGVLINNVPTFRVENMPYGGIKASGYGREGIRYAMEEMTELKSMIVHL